MKLQKEIGNKIRELKLSGKTVKEITHELNCSKQIVYYHTSESYKDKVKSLLKRHREKPEIAYKKRLRQKYENFFRINRSNKDREFTDFEFTFEEFLEKLLSNPKCYLTGRDIDLSDTTSFHPDHIVPVSRNGKYDISNLGFLCREANIAKSNLLLEDFISLCKEVANNIQ